LKTALMFEGVFRPVARRTLTPLMLKIGSGPAKVTWSTALPGTIATKVEGRTPCDPLTFSVSKRTLEARLFGSASRWVGKSAADNWKFGPFTTKFPTRGFSWFLDLRSAPAEK